MIDTVNPGESIGVDPKWEQRKMESVQDALAILHFASVPERAVEIHERYVALFATTKRPKGMNGSINPERLMIRQNLIDARNMLQDLFRKEQRKKNQRHK